MSKKLNWKNLKESRCPDCGQPLVLKKYPEEDKKYFDCENCAYYIKEERYKEIIKNMFRQESCFIRY